MPEATSKRRRFASCTGRPDFFVANDDGTPPEVGRWTLPVGAPNPKWRATGRECPLCGDLLRRMVNGTPGGRIVAVTGPFDARRNRYPIVLDPFPVDRVFLACRDGRHGFTEPSGEAQVATASTGHTAIAERTGSDRA